MKILSLFDGISCGLLALNKCGIKVDMYFASEIEPNAIKVAQRNNSTTIEVGDITKIYYKDGILYTPEKSYHVGHIDLICGGSPCTNFSSIGYANGMSSGDIEILSLEQYLELRLAVFFIFKCLSMKNSHHTLDFIKQKVYNVNKEVYK